LHPARRHRSSLTKFSDRSLDRDTRREPALDSVSRGGQIDPRPTLFPAREYQTALRRFAIARVGLMTASIFTNIPAPFRTTVLLN
jgi:hypothetical protein